MSKMKSSPGLYNLHFHLVYPVLAWTSEIGKLTTDLVIIFKQKPKKSLF